MNTDIDRTSCEGAVLYADQPGGRPGHLLPGTMFVGIGVLLAFELGARARRMSAAASSSLAPPSFAKQPLFSIPLAAVIAVSTLVGVYGEVTAGASAWYDFGRAECYRREAGAALAHECPLYNVAGGLNARGHSEHEALYLTFLAPALLSLGGWLWRWWCGVGAQPRPPRAAVAVASPGKEGATAGGCGGPPASAPAAAPAPPLAVVDRLGLALAFLGCSALWANHSTAMTMLPCWSEKTQRMMAFNMHVHGLLLVVNQWSAVAAGVAALLPARWDPVVLVAALLVGQGSWLLYLADVLYATEAGGRWVPEGSRPRHTSHANCSRASETCKFNELNTVDLGLLKGHVVSVFVLWLMVSLAVAVLVFAVGWCAGLRVPQICGGDCRGGRPGEGVGRGGGGWRPCRSPCCSTATQRRRNQDYESVSTPTEDAEEGNGEGASHPLVAAGGR